MENCGGDVMVGGCCGVMVWGLCEEGWGVGIGG